MFVNSGHRLLYRFSFIFNLYLSTTEHCLSAPAHNWVTHAFNICILATSFPSLFGNVFFGSIIQPTFRNLRWRLVLLHILRPLYVYSWCNWLVLPCIGWYWLVLACIGLHWLVLACIGWYRPILACIGLYLACIGLALACIGLYLLVLACIGLHCFVLDCIGVYWLLFACICLYLLVFACICLYWLVLAFAYIFPDEVSYWKRENVVTSTSLSFCTSLVSEPNYRGIVQSILFYFEYSLLRCD